MQPHHTIALGERHEARLQNAGEAMWSRQEVQAGGAGRRKVWHEQRVGGGVRGLLSHYHTWPIALGERHKAGLQDAGQAERIQHAGGGGTLEKGS